MVKETSETPSIFLRNNRLVHKKPSEAPPLFLRDNRLIYKKTSEISPMSRRDKDGFFSCTEMLHVRDNDFPIGCFHFPSRRDVRLVEIVVSVSSHTGYVSPVGT